MILKSNNFIVDSKARHSILMLTLDEAVPFNF